MPVYTYECGACGHVFEGIYLYRDDVPCNECGAMTHKVMGAPNFRIKGFRAENQYGRKFIDTPGKNKNTGEEYGYSYTSNRGGTVEHNMGNRKEE